MKTFLTVLLVLALIAAKEPSEIELSGGTHNPSAPTLDYLNRVFLPVVARMGAKRVLRGQLHGHLPGQLAAIVAANTAAAGATATPETASGEAPAPGGSYPFVDRRRK